MYCVLKFSIRFFLANLDKETLRLNKLLSTVQSAQDQRLSEVQRNEAALEARLHGEETKRKNLELEVQQLTQSRLSQDEKRREQGDELYTSKEQPVIIILMSFQMTYLYNLITFVAKYNLVCMINKMSSVKFEHVK